MTTVPIRSWYFTLALGAASWLLSACVGMGDSDAVKRGIELAVVCKTDAALAQLDRAVRGGGISGGIADLERVAVLRDVGRTAEADTAMAERHRRVSASEQNIADAERGVAQAVEDLRRERERKTGRRLCP